jgi:hypothetical protein
MSKRVNKHAYLPLISFFMIMSTFVLTVIYISVYKATIKNLNQRLKQSEDTYNEQPKFIYQFGRHRINIHAQRTYENEITRLQNSKGLLIISLISFLACIPVVSVQIIDEIYTLPSYLHLYTFLLTRLCSLFNPLFYGLYSSKFLFGYKNVLNLIIHGKRLNFTKYEEERKAKK